MENRAVINSVKQNANHTPSAPRSLLNRNAAGIMTNTYLNRNTRYWKIPAGMH